MYSDPTPGRKLEAKCVFYLFYVLIKKIVEEARTIISLSHLSIIYLFIYLPHPTAEWDQLT